MNNEINVNDFEFWRYDFELVSQDIRTGKKRPIVDQINWFTPIGFSRNNALVVVDIKGKKHWIKQEFWNSSSSPFWKTTDRYGILVRLKTEDVTFEEVVEKIAYIRSKEDELTEDACLSLGFEKLPHYTVANNLIYKLSGNRYLSIGNIGTQNETLFICQSETEDYIHTTDAISIHNYDRKGNLRKSYMKLLLSVLK